MARGTEQSYRLYPMRVVFAHAHGDHEPLHPSEVNELFHVRLAGAEGMRFALAGIQIEAFEITEAIVGQLRHFAGVATSVPAGFDVIG